MKAPEVDLSGRVVVITGGGRGMGREMAVACARAGAAVTVTAAPGSDEAADSIAAEIGDAVAAIRAEGGRAHGVLADVARWDDCRRVVEETVAAFGGLHVLVNNAGKSGRYVAGGSDERRVPFFKADPAGYCEVNATNIDGPFLMARAAADHMIAAGWGRVVNISKGVDAMHRPCNTPYGPSKAALEAATIAWAEDLFDTGVTVNSLSPGGAVDTKFGDGRLTGRGLPADIMVPCLMWLLSPAADGVTGCRFEAHRWDDARTPDAAAEACREAQIFPRPSRETKLTLAWRPSGGQAQ